MKNTEELMQEILRRSDERKRKTQKKLVRVYTVLSTCMLVLLIGTIYSFAGFSELEGDSSVLGAVLLGPETGGYILTALLAFSAGVIITMAVQKYRRDRDRSEKSYGKQK